MVVVTGGSGLLGSYLIKALLEGGVRVRALHRNRLDPFLLNTDERMKVEWVSGDILDTSLLESLLSGADVVYHCAALVSFDPRDAHRLFRVNTEGAANVVNAALDAGVRKLVHVSSVATLGRAPGEAANGSAASQLVDESLPWNSNSNPSRYGRSKYLAEVEVWRAMAEGLDAVIVNPSTMLGAGDWDKGSSKIFKNVYAEFPWYTEGINGFVDVRDVARAMILLGEGPVSGQRFILSAGELSYRDLFNAIAAAFGKRSPYKKVSPLMAEVVWRVESLKSRLSGKSPLLTAETARTAQSVVRFDNRRIGEALPGFRFTQLDEAIRYHCEQLKERYGF